MGRYRFRKRKPVDYSDKYRFSYRAEVKKLTRPSANACGRRRKEKAVPEHEVDIVCIWDALITNKDGETFRAQDVETTNERLTVSGVAEDGAPIISSGLQEWCGFNLNSACPMLGVSDGSRDFALMTPQAAFVDLFCQSKAPVEFAAWLVQNAMQKPTMSLEALTSDFLKETDNSLSMFAKYRELPLEFAKQHAITAGKLLEAHWAGQFPKLRSIRELNWFMFHNNFQGANVVSALFEQYFIRQENLINELGETTYWERMQIAQFSNLEGKRINLSRDNLNPDESFELDTGTTKCCLRAGDFVRLKTNTKNILTGRIQSVNLKDRSAHVQQFCTGKETLLGNFSSKWELFATHDCADIPCAAIVEKLDNVCLDGTRKVDQLFCRYETCSEYGFFQKYVVPEKLTGDCSECEREAELKLFEKPMRIEKSEIIQLRGEKYAIGTFIRISECVSQPAAKSRPINKYRNAKQYMAQRPELWRYKEKTVVHVLNLQRVARITGIEFHDDDNKEPTLFVSYYKRPEEIYLNEEVARAMHPNLLLPSIQKKIHDSFKWENIAGKAYVVNKKHLQDVNSWLNQGPNRFFVQDELPENLPINALNPSDTAAPVYPKLPQADRLKLLDLFCGAGVLSYGLQEAGLAEVSWGVDLDNDCTKSFKMNFPNASALTMSVNEFLRLLEKGESEDINGEALPKRGEVGMICGGTPCQGFSLLNKHMDSDGSEFNRMAIVSLLRAVEVLDPKYVLVENVPGSARSEDGFFVKFLINNLLQMGFQCRLNKFQSANFGVPQCRSRLLILGAKLGQPMPEFPDVTHSTGKKISLLKLNQIEIENPSMELGAPFRQVLATNAIDDLPLKAATGCSYKEPPTNPFQAQMRKDSPHLSNHLNINSSELQEKRISYIPENANWMHIPNLKLKLANGGKTPKLKYVVRNGYPVVCPCHVNLVCDKERLRRKYKGSLIPFSLAHSADKNSHWSSCFGRIPTAGLFPSMTTSLQPLAKQGRVVHHKAHRLLTVREMARAQAVPDSFKFHGRTRSKISQIGNAVPPPLTFHVALKIVESILEEQNEAGDKQEPFVI